MMTRIIARSLTALFICAAAHGAGSAPVLFPSVPALTHKQTHRYPWHDHITTTVFWIGDKSNRVTSGLNWVPNAAGVNDQRLPDGHALNPYYFALPFNDLNHPDLADKWLPAGWSRPNKPSTPRSACLDRWIEIKNAKGQICFAQWKDFGPVRDDDASYVFGVEHPAAPFRGLDVSPAVAKKLGIDRSASLSWRFVDDEDVKEGPWLDRDSSQMLITSPNH
jgi:hypothetical protein